MTAERDGHFVALEGQDLVRLTNVFHPPLALAVAVIWLPWLAPGLHAAPSMVS